jgi:CDP-glycerol glycerophosphotransferase (TagB/SpsB family)
MLDTPEMSCIDMSLYPNLKFIKRGRFIDLMWGADYLILDSLNSSPIYEALMTDKPILFYPGIENQEWDENFLSKLSERAVCFFNEKSYLEGLKDFVVNPKRYIDKSGMNSFASVADEYMPKVSREKFWSIIYDSFFLLPN